MTNALKVTPRGETEIIMTRTFGAPRELVFQAFIRPELVQRWLLGPDGNSMPVCRMDVRPGGSFRWVWREDATGKEMGMGGVFREVSPPERLVHTEAFDDFPGEAVVTTVFTEQNGKTLMTITMVMPNRQARDGVIASGMEQGAGRSYDRLEEMLQETAAAR